MKRRPLATVCLVLCLCLLVGTFFVTETLSCPKGWEGETALVTGKVYQKEETGGNNTKQTILYLKLYSVSVAGEQFSFSPGKEQAICYLKAGIKEPEIGSIVSVKGRLKYFQKATNPGQFDAESYYRILKISFQLNQTEIQQKSVDYNRFGENLYRFKKKCANILDSVLPPKEASLMKTILLGEKRAPDAEVKALYQRNGIAHILAISGLHVSLLGMTLYRLLKKMAVLLPVRLVVCGGIIILYVCMTGFSVSSVRAMLMFLIHMTALACRRTYDLLTAAALAAFLLLLEQPLYWYYSGFLFSFGCIFAIGLVVPSMTYAKRMPEGIRLRILSAVSLTLACLPFQLWFFYETPLFSAFLNLLVIPLMSFLLPGGFLLLVVGTVQQLTGGIVGVAASVVAKPGAMLVTGILFVYEQSCLLIESLPIHSYISGRPEKWQMAGYLAVLCGLVFLKKKWSLLWRWLFLLAGVVLLLLPLPSKTTVTFLDVGQGDCIHVRSKSGCHYLIDGGSSDVSKVGEYRIIPYLKYQGAECLEAVFVTHPDEDHCNGILELISLTKTEGITIRQLYLPDVHEKSKSQAYRALADAAKKAGIPVSYLSKGMHLQEEELAFLCLHPLRGYETENENAYSLVLLMQYREFDVLLTGDVEEEGERALITEMKEYDVHDVEVLKVAHHGSRYSTTEEFLTYFGQAGLKLAVVSCGANNSYGHPHEETLLRLTDVGCPVVTTPEYGAITVEFGETMKVYGYRR